MNKETLQLIGELNSDYYERTNDAEGQFFVEGNEFAYVIKFNDVLLYNSEDDSLHDHDTDKEIPIKSFLRTSWESYVGKIMNTAAFPKNYK
jgi:hypothetical protein